MKKIDDSKYKASAINVIRNSDGQLISVVEVTVTRYLENPITDQYLDTLDIIKKGKMNGENVKMMQTVVHLNFGKCTSEIIQTSGYISECNSYNRPFVSSLVINNDKNERFEIFRGLNHGFFMKPTDTLTSLWTIISPN